MTEYADVRTTSRRWRFTALATTLAMMGALMAIGSSAQAQTPQDALTWLVCFPVTGDLADADLEDSNVTSNEDGTYDITLEDAVEEAFPLPLNMTGIGPDDEFQPGDAFGLSTVSTFVLPEFFLQGVAVELKLGLDTALEPLGPFIPESTTGTDAQTRVPDPEHAASADPPKHSQWVPGDIPLGEWDQIVLDEDWQVAADDLEIEEEGWWIYRWDGDIVFGPDSLEAVSDFLAEHFTPTEGGGLKTIPDPVSAGYTVTGEDGDTVDFIVDSTPVNMDADGSVTVTVNEEMQTVGGAANSININPVLEIVTVLACMVSDEEPVLDEDGNPETDEDGEVIFQPQEVEPYWTNDIVAPPHVFVTGVENQHVDTHARNAGDTLTFEGPGWPESGTVNAVELCDLPDGTGTCHGLDALSASVDAEGVLTGTGDVPVAVADVPGDWYLRATVDTTESDDGMTELFSQLTILDHPVLTLSPDEGGIGSTVTLGGTGWNPLAAMEAQVIDPPDGEFGTATIDENGVLSGTISITSDDADQARADFEDPVMTIEARDVDALTTNESNTAEFTLLWVVIEVEEGEGLSLFQLVEFELEGDTLIFSQVGAVIVMETLTIDGTDQVSTGAINQVEVNERRGTLEGWEIFGHLQTDLLQTGQDAENPEEHRYIPAEDLTWDPVCTPITSDPGEIITGDPNHLAAPTLLCQGDPGGGITQGDADLELQVPSTQAAGFHSAVLELELISGGSL